MKITILDDYFDTVRTLPCFEKLAGHEVTAWNDHVQDIDALAARLLDTEALVLIRERTQIREPLLERLGALRLISQRSVYPHIDIEACTRRGVIVSSNMHAGSPCHAAAELTWGLIIAALRRIPQQMAALRTGTWQIGVGNSLRGKTLGIYGYGRIGAIVAGYGRAFGMHVLGYDPFLSQEQAGKLGIDKVDNVADMLPRVDYLTVHTPLTPETENLISFEELEIIKPGARLINCARGGIYNEEALLQGLKSGKLAGVAGGPAGGAVGALVYARP